jgi:hypothetical protein
MTTAANPKYWFMFTLEWPEDATSMAEAAAVFAPSTIPRDIVSPNLKTLLEVVDKYAASRERRLHWLSDIARWLALDGLTWDDFDVDWMGAIDELCSTPFLRLDLTLSSIAYAYVGDPSSKSMTLYFPDGSTEVATDEEREKIREAFTDLIAHDWPEYVARVNVVAP